MPKHITQTSTEWTSLTSTVANLSVTGAPAGVAWLTSSNFIPDGGIFAVTGTVSGTSGTFQQFTSSFGQVNTLLVSGTGGSYQNVSSYIDQVSQLWTDYESSQAGYSAVSNSAFAPISNNIMYMLRAKTIRFQGSTNWPGVGDATGGTHMFSIPVLGIAQAQGQSYNAFPVAYISANAYYTTYVQMSESTTGTTFQIAAALPSASNVIFNWTALLS